MPAKGPGFGSSGRMKGGVPRGRYTGGAKGMSKRGGSFVSKQGATYTTGSASRAAKSPVINSSGTSPKAFRKGNAAANRDFGRTKTADRRFTKNQAGRFGAEGPKRSAPAKKRGKR